MTLTELRYIVTLAQEQHFGRAAERCFVSQPTLSIAVKKLEEELDVALFERSKSRVKATPLGEQIIAQAQRVLEQTALIKEMATAGKDQLSSPLNVGAIFTIGPFLFPHFIPQLQKIAPKMPLYVEEGCLFVIGDNRNGSRDSRSPDIGLVDKREVLGKVIFLFLPGTNGTDSSGQPNEERDFGRIVVVD